MLRISWAIGFCFFLWCASAQAQSHPDACQAQLPRSLSDALARAYPGYRTPLETDNAPEDIETNRDHGGTGCLGVGTGDLTGDGKLDYVVGLTARKGSAGLAVIALPRRGGWNFQKIRSGSEAARYLQYVAVVGPGRFDRAASVSAPLEPGEKSSIVCPHAAARVGTIASTASVYCYQDGRWLHVAVAN